MLNIVKSIFSSVCGKQNEPLKFLVVVNVRQMHLHIRTAKENPD